METNFSDWLRDELQKRDMTQADLSRKSGVTPPQISRIISGSRGAESKTLSAIAKALSLPPETVYEAAGLPTSKSPENKTIRQITFLTDQLPPEEQQGILEFVKLRLRLAEDKGKYETRKTPRSASSPKRP